MIINKVECYKISCKYGDGKVFGQSKGVKSLTIIAVHTNKKIVGYGETYSGIYTPDIVDKIVKYLSSFIIGKKIEDKNLLENINIPFVGQYGLIKSALSGIEVAIYDILSKKNKVSLNKFLNKKSNESKIIYASGGSVVFDKNKIAEEINAIQKKEFNFYKMRVGFQSIKKDIERVNTAIENLDFDNKIMIDAIMGSLKNKWKSKTVINFASNFSNSKIMWLEEPLDPLSLKEYSDLRSKLKIPIAFGESFTNFKEFENAINFSCSDYLQPDVTHCGISDTKKLINIKTNKFKIAMHSWGSPLSFLANLHFALAFSQVNYMEYPLVKLEFLSDQLNDLIEIKKGKIIFNDKKIGLGINLSNNILNKYKFIRNSGWSI